MRRRVSFSVTSEAVLETVAAAARPLGMARGPAECALLRRTYFDTSDGLLRERRLVLSWQLEADGRQVVRLSRVVAVNLQGIVEEEVLEAPITGSGFYATMAGDSEVATRVREVVDAAALRPLLALDVDRETRVLRPRWLGRPGYRLHLDTILAHAGDGTRTMHEITLVELPRASRPGLQPLAARLAALEGVVQDGLDTPQRARRLLEPARSDEEPEVPHAVRLLLLVLRGGRVALSLSPAGYVLPSAPGSGEDTARTLSRELFPGGADGDVELVGFAPVRRSGTDVELWLQEDARTDRGGEGLVWIPLSELLERVGSPRLRHPTLVAALHLLVRSEIGLRLLREAHTDREAPVVLTTARRAPGREPGDDPEDLLDPELSILDFNLRVLEMAEDPAVPLLERFRFLSIFASNMDEFFVVRVGRLKMVLRRRSETSTAEDDDTLAALDLMDAVSIRARSLQNRQYRCLSQLLLPALAEAGIRVRRWDELAPEERQSLERRFAAEIFPLLTPRAMTSSPGHPFPRLTSLGLSLAAILRDPARQDRRHLAHVPIPEELPRFLEIPDTGDRVPVDDVIIAHASQLFPSLELVEAHAFRVSRLGDVEIDEDASRSLLAAVADEVESRPYKPVVRIEVARSMPREVRAHLLRELRAERGTESAGLSRADIYEVDGLLDLRRLSELATLPLPGGTFPPFTPALPLTGEPSVFDVLRRRDLLVHHPYESFDDTVGRFLDEAADDPAVVAIKLTLYRTGRDSPLMDALLRALRAGKEVAVFVELKARFDEESNIAWTRRIREAGGHVVFGLVGYKTHAKTLLVVRREPDGVRRYVHVGTGNYNAATARLYTDLGLMSSDPDLGADLSDLFNELMGSAAPPERDHRLLWVAPGSLARGILRSIDREIEHARAGRPARIQAKLNGLSDRKVVRALYRAAGAGVRVDLIVRAICTLRPGVHGLSEGIHVRSILGRFLEHARIYYFENAGAPEYWIGSADWRRRNLRRRVEVAAPVHDRESRRRLRLILDRELADPRAWILRPDGAYERLHGPGEAAQDAFLREASEARRRS